LKALLEDEDSYVHVFSVDEVYESDNDFMKYDLIRFKANFKNLRDAIEIDKFCIEFDTLSVKEDKKKFPRNAMTLRGIPFWDGSEAQRIVKDDAENNRLDEIVISQYHTTKDCFKIFPLKDFSNYVRKARSSVKQNVYWQAKRNRLGRQKHEAELQLAEKDETNRNI
jgi:hypothetical protein